jgi:hypothetical protein
MTMNQDVFLISFKFTQKKSMDGYLSVHFA